MNTGKRIAQVIALIIALTACQDVMHRNLVQAQEEIQTWPYHVYITGFDTTVITTGDDIERAWLMIGIGSVIDMDNCDAGTHVFTIALEIWPEYYVDEITLENASCHDEEVDPYELVNWYLVDDMADHLESMIQDDVIPTLDYPLTGTVSNGYELYQVIHDYNREFESHLVWTGTVWKYWNMVYRVCISLVR